MENFNIGKEIENMRIALMFAANNLSEQDKKWLGQFFELAEIKFEMIVDYIIELERNQK